MLFYVMPLSVMYGTENLLLCSFNAMNCLKYLVAFIKLTTFFFPILQTTYFLIVSSNGLAQNVSFDAVFTSKLKSI